MAETTSKIVVMVLRDDNRILFGKRASAEEHLKGWTPISAGGHIEEGETTEEAIIREAKEELGLDVTLTHFLGQVEHIDHFLVFQCKLIGGKLRLNHAEVEEVKWIPITESEKFSNNILSRKILDLLRDK